MPVKEKDMEDEIKNAKQAREAIEEKATNIRYIPEEFITPELIQMCIEEGKNKDGYVFPVLIEFAPRQYITAELVSLSLTAVEKHRNNEKTNNFDQMVSGFLSDTELLKCVRFIPAELWTAKLSDFCLEMVGKRGINLDYVPHEHITAAMSNAAFNQDYRAIEFMPDNHKTAQMCFIAIKQEFPKMFKYALKELMSPELEALCIQKVKEKAGRFRNDIPDDFKTSAISLEAVKGHISMFDFIPENLRTQEIYFEAVKRSGVILERTPNEFKTAEMCLEAVKQKPLLFRDCVPENLRTAEVSLEAVKGYGELLEFVPENLRTEEICFEAVKQDGRACDHVPENLRTERILETAKKNGYSVKAKAEDLTSMDAYYKVLIDQMQYMPLETRQAMVNTMPNLPPEVREALLKP
jgi:hypothetical protein